MKTVTKLVLMCSAVMWAVMASGCGSSFGRTADERSYMYLSISRSEWGMAKDDFDNFMMMDRRSRLSRWH